MDIVAANYATTKLGLNDYDKLKNQDKCNELVVLTSDMIANKFKMLDIIYLKQRTEYGSNISDPQDKSKKAYGSTKVMYGNKQSLMDGDEKVPWKKYLENSKSQKREIIVLPLRDREMKKV